MSTLPEREHVATFVVTGEPVSKARARFTNYGSRTRAYTPQRTKDAEAGMALAFRASGGKFEPDREVTFAVDATFYNATRQRRDVDNMLKLVLDGLNGVAWVDDTQVMDVTGHKRFVLAKTEARTEVSVYRVGVIDRLTKVCRGCGESFVTFRSLIDSVHYCSAACRGVKLVEMRTHNCAQCGKEFTRAARSTRPAGNAFCDKECRREFSRLLLSCSVCATEFYAYRSHVRKIPYCSSDCRKVVDAQRRRERRTTTFPGTCLICGAGTTRKEYQRCNPCKLAGKAVPA